MTYLILKDRELIFRPALSPGHLALTLSNIYRSPGLALDIKSLVSVSLNSIFIPANIYFLYISGSFFISSISCFKLESF